MEWGLRAQPTNGAVNGWSCRMSLKRDQHGGAVLRTRLWRGSDSPYLAEKARCLSVRRIVQCTRTLPRLQKIGMVVLRTHPRTWRISRVHGVRANAPRCCAVVGGRMMPCRGVGRDGFFRGTQVPTRGADWAWVGCLDVHAPPHNRGPVELAHCVLPKSSSTACRPPVCYEPTGARRWCDRSEQFRARELPLGHGTLESRTHVADTCGLLPSHRWRCTAQGEMGVLAPCRAHTGKGVRVGRGVCRSKWRRTFV